MKYNAPLRNYQQMVRVVRTQDSENNTDNKNHNADFKLGNPYGESNSTVSRTDLVLRTLEELGLPGTTQRRPGPPDNGGLLSPRTSSSYYHQLNSFSQQYINGTGGPLTQSRLSNLPGTKLRTALGNHNYTKMITPQTNLQTNQQNQTKAQTDKSTPKMKKRDQQFTAFE